MNTLSLNAFGEAMKAVVCLREAIEEQPQGIAFDHLAMILLDLSDLVDVTAEAEGVTRAARHE